MGVFVILAASQASPAPDPDTHIHVHMDAEDSKGGKSPKTGGGVLASNSSGCATCPCPRPPTWNRIKDSSETKAADYSGDAGDYGHWRPKRCHPHCMPHCLPTCRPCPCSTCPCP